MKYVVYQITNNINGKIYIGVHKTDDIDDGYMGSGKLITLAIQKYGIENFEKSILFVFENSEEMYEMESTLVTEDFISNNMNYNLKIGGFGGFDYINKNKLNLYDGHSKQNKLKFQKQSIINAERSKLDKKWNDRRRKKISDGVKKSYIGRDNPFSGKFHSDETKRMIGEKNSKNQSGSKNSQYGKCWVHSLDEKRSLSISKTELETYLRDGWIKGRKMKFS